MSKLISLDNSLSIVILNEEIEEIFRTNSVDYLVNYSFNNKILCQRIWDILIQHHGMGEIPQGRLYKYLTQVGFDMEDKSFSTAEIIKFWNLPNVIEGKLFNIICPEVLKYLSQKDENKDKYKKILELLIPIFGCSIVDKYVEFSKLKLAEFEAQEARELEDKEYQDKLKSHMKNLSNSPAESVINALLLLNGYKGSIFNGARLEKLIWFGTGYLLTDIIHSISKYVKIRDEVVCTLNPQFQSVLDVYYDSENFGLNNPKIYEHYYEACKFMGEQDGRLEGMYPGYSLATLKSSSKVKPSQPKKSNKISEHEVLLFAESNLNAEFEWADVENYMSALGIFGLTPRLKDEGDGYSGIDINSDKLSQLKRVLLKYDVTEFQGIRKLLAGIIDEEVRLTRMSDEEIREFDNDLSCEMIERLLSWDEISYNQLMEDMKWLRLVGHVGVSLVKVSKDKYRIQFNTVSFIRVVELIYKSDLGYHTILNVLLRLSQTKAFYRDVYDNFNPAIWNTHISQMQLRFD